MHDVAGVDWLGSGACLCAPHSFPLILSQKMRKSNCEGGCEGKSIRGSLVEVVEEGSPRISTRGNIIISKVNI